jgi:hypothetical protein
VGHGGGAVLVDERTGHEAVERERRHLGVRLASSHGVGETPADAGGGIEPAGPPPAVEVQVRVGGAADDRRRTRLIRLVGAVLAEQNDEWTEGRRYMGLELLAKSRIRIITTEPDPHDEPAVATEPLTA